MDAVTDRGKSVDENISLLKENSKSSNPTFIVGSVI